MTEKRKVRVAFVGVGKQAQEHRIPGFLELVLDGEVDVVAVCDGDGKLAKRVASMFAVPGSFGPWHERDAGVRPSYARVLESAFPTPRSYESVAEMIEGEHRHGGIDLAVVCVPHHAHRAVTTQLLKAGVDVLCEKPMATSLTDARDMAEIARRERRQLSIGYQYGYVPEWVRERVQRVGRVRKVRAVFLMEDNIPTNPAYWTEAGVWDDLPGHPLSVVLPLLGGEPVSVIATGTGNADVIHTVSAAVTMSGGVDLDIEVSWKAGVNKVGATIFGDAGRLEVTVLARELDGSPYPAKFVRIGEVPELGPPAVLYTEAIEAQHRDVVRAVRDRRPLRFTPDHGLSLERITEGGRESLRLGAEVAA